jgi:hypothetical protein
MGETLIVRAIVPEELKEQFEIWYQEEHLPEAFRLLPEFWCQTCHQLEWFQIA